jgi:hypothetical protein
VEVSTDEVVVLTKKLKGSHATSISIGMFQTQDVGDKAEV